ncbi:hypothetical protein [Burkholderia ambifaria]|uniref:hypothetical protein n=1 Tax=Burkholderia ambifaria TaxID=152480 RepID=UPI00315C6ACD
MLQILFEDDPDFRVDYAWITEYLKLGVSLHPYHNMFLSAAHTADDISATDLACGVVKHLRSTGDIPPALPLVPLFGRYAAMQTGWHPMVTAERQNKGTGQSNSMDCRTVRYPLLATLCRPSGCWHQFFQPTSE